MFQAAAYNISYASGAFTGEEGRVTKHEFDEQFRPALNDLLMASGGRWIVVDTSFMAFTYTTYWELELLVVVPYADDSETQFRMALEHFESFMTRKAGFYLDTTLRMIEGNASSPTNNDEGEVAKTDWQSRATARRQSAADKKLRAVRSVLGSARKQ